MINKMPSAKAHWVKFLLALPLIAILLIAFRTNAQKQNEAETLTILGIVLNGSSRSNNIEPLEGVSITEKFSNTTVVTDHRGYFLMTIPAKQFPVKTEIICTKEGFDELVDRTNIESRSKESLGLIKTIFIARPGGFTVSPITYYIRLDEKNSVDGATGRYEAAYKKVEEFNAGLNTLNQLTELSKNSEKPYWAINGTSCILFNQDLMVSTPEPTNIVFVDGKQMTGEEVNRTIKRNSIKTARAVVAEYAKKKYGIDGAVYEVYINTLP